MIIVCPNCKTSYDLPEGKAPEGTRARCAVCGTVFTIGDDQPEPGISPQEQEKKKGSFLPVLLLILILAAFAAAYYWRDTEQIQGLRARAEQIYAKVTGKEPAPAIEEAPVSLVQGLDISSVRQFISNNESVGTITVITGKISNRSSEPRGLIRVRGTLSNDSGTVVAEKDQLAGTEISLAQLRVMDENDLNAVLNDAETIAAVNTSVPPDGAIPFTVLFINPPADATGYNIQIIGAVKPKAE